MNSAGASGTEGPRRCRWSGARSGEGVHRGSSGVRPCEGAAVLAAAGQEGKVGRKTLRSEQQAKEGSRQKGGTLGAGGAKDQMCIS